MSVYGGTVQSARLRLSFVLAVAAGTFAGAVLAAVFSDTRIASVFRLFVIGSFTSRVSALGIILPPAAVTLLFFSFAWLCSRPIRRFSLVALIHENDE